MKTYEFRVLDLSAEGWVDKLNAFGAEGFSITVSIPPAPYSVKHEGLIILTRER